MEPNLLSLQKILEESSQKLNLFSAGDRLKIGEKHIPDATAVLDFWHLKAKDRILDIGTGGGLPGLALAVACPTHSFTLMDAREKKIHAVQSMADTLRLDHVQTVAGRLEELAHEAPFRERFDVVTARALAPLPTLLEYAAGFLKPGGSFYAWKGPDYPTELSSSKNAQTLLGLPFIKEYPYTLATGEARCILHFEKVNTLNSRYPRAIGVPLAKPL
jgi:16S rRNA (guanine527-N7)-methyltransferase